MGLTLHSPAVVEAVTLRFQAYEKALLANDVDALVSFFWDSADVVRYGHGEQLYGSTAIEHFRRHRVINFKDRLPLRLTVQAFGEQVACTLYEYSVVIDGVARQGRQTQTWVLLDGVGWKIVNAHVSLVPLGAEGMWSQYLQHASTLAGLNVRAEHRPGAAVQIERAAQLAAPLLAFPLPDDVEPAGLFRPLS